MYGVHCTLYTKQYTVVNCEACIQYTAFVIGRISVAVDMSWVVGTNVSGNLGVDLGSCMGAEVGNTMSREMTDTIQYYYILLL